MPDPTDHPTDDPRSDSLGASNGDSSDASNEDSMDDRTVRSDRLLDGLLAYGAGLESAVAPVPVAEVLGDRDQQTAAFGPDLAPPERDAVVISLDEVVERDASRRPRPAATRWWGVAAAAAAVVVVLVVTTVAARRDGGTSAPVLSGPPAAATSDASSGSTVVPAPSGPFDGTAWAARSVRRAGEVHDLNTDRWQVSFTGGSIVVVSCYKSAAPYLVQDGHLLVGAWIPAVAASCGPSDPPQEDGIAGWFAEVVGNRPTVTVEDQPDRSTLTLDDGTTTIVFARISGGGPDAPSPVTAPSPELGPDGCSTDPATPKFCVLTVEPPTTTAPGGPAPDVPKPTVPPSTDLPVPDPSSPSPTTPPSSVPPVTAPPTTVPAGPVPTTVGAAPAIDPASLEGRRFSSWTAWVDGQPKALVGLGNESPALQLTFKSGQLGAHAACNWQGFTYTLEGATLVTEPGSTTLIGCPGEPEAEDAWYASVLGSRPTLRFDGADLLLATGTTVIRYQPVP